MGLKPSASQGKARLRGLYRIIYSKTIISVIAWGASFPGVFNFVQIGSTFVRTAISPTCADHKSRLAGRKPACAGFRGRIPFADRQARRASARGAAGWVSAALLSVPPETAAQVPVNPDIILPTPPGGAP